MQKPPPFYSHISPQIFPSPFEFHPVDKAAAPLLPEKIEVAISVENYNIMQRIERKRNAGSDSIEGVVESKIRPLRLFRSGGSTVIINARAQFTSGSRRPPRQLALLNDTERRARFKSPSPRRCSLNGTCHHVKIQFVPRQVGNENWGEGGGERRQRSRGRDRERYPPLCYELNVRREETRSKF